jgi:quercetin dioxygenase-like cupin family protein
MYRRSFLAANAALLLGVAPIGGRFLTANAQDATPGSDAIVLNELAPGVTAEIFAAAPSAGAPGQTVYLARFAFQSGAEIFPHGHPGTTVLGVTSGSFGWTLVEGTAHVVRGAAGANPAAPEDVIEAGAEVVLEPGDSIYYEHDVIHTARGAGDEPAIVLGTLVLETGAPLLMSAEDMKNMDHGTPDA